MQRLNTWEGLYCHMHAGHPSSDCSGCDVFAPATARQGLALRCTRGAGSGQIERSV